MSLAYLMQERMGDMARTILIADDLDANRQVLCEAFARRGYRVDAVKDGFEAVEYVRQSPVTLGVFDYWMPRMGGVDAMLAIRKLQLAMPIVITTSERNRELRERALSNGAQGFFLKPVEMSELLGLVGQLIGEETALTVRTTTTHISIRVTRGERN